MAGSGKLGHVCVQISRCGLHFWARETHSMVVSTALPSMRAAMTIPSAGPRPFKRRLSSVRLSARSHIGLGA